MIRFIYIPLLFILSVGPDSTKAEYLRDDDLNSFVVSCYLEQEIPVFCSKQQIDDPHLKIHLPLFKSVMIDEKIHAFRIMATVENLSKKNLVGAKIKLVTCEESAAFTKNFASPYFLFVRSCQRKPSGILVCHVVITLMLCYINANKKLMI